MGNIDFKDKPLVSIIMLSFNSEKCIKSAIDSILFQNYVHWELLIYDDASIDNTINIINSYYDKRIKLIGINKERQGHRTIGKMRNICINKSKGDYLAIHDSDDIRLMDNLSTCINLFLDFPEFNVISTMYEEINENGIILPISSCLKNRKNILKGKSSKVIDITSYFSSSSKGFHCPITPCTTLLKTDIVKQVGGYHNTLKYHTDSYLYRKIWSISNSKFGLSPKITAYYRIHSDQRSKQKYNEGWEEPKSITSGLERQNFKPQID